MKYVILYGNAAEAMWLEGPYDSFDEANRSGPETYPFIVEFLHHPGHLTQDKFPKTPLKIFEKWSSDILIGAAERFPGLVNGEDEVNGGDLVEYITTAFAHRNRSPHGLEG